LKYDWVATSSNPILRMFIFRLYLFAEQIGLDMEKIRFRQHKSDEMAHYAKDCWDLEAEIFSKWLEITGIADREDYDLKTHDLNSQFKIKKNNIPITKYKLTPKAKEIFKQFEKSKALEIMNQYKETLMDSQEQLWILRNN
jgi:glycyl-tRNA synthetase